MAALLLMACSQNEPKLVSKDKKAALEAAKAIPSLIGQPIDKANAKLIKLGYEETTDLSSLPARRAPRKAKAQEANYREYCFNAPDTATIKSQEASAKYINETLKAKKLIIILSVSLDEKGNVAGISGQYFGSQEVENIHQLYPNITKHLYNGLDVEKWQAYLVDSKDIESENYKIFTVRDKFEEAFAEIETPAAQEEGAGEEMILMGMYMGDASEEIEIEGLEVAPVLGAFGFGLPDYIPLM